MAAKEPVESKGGAARWSGALRRVVFALAVCTLVAGACGSGESDSDGDSAAETTESSPPATEDPSASTSSQAPESDDEAEDGSDGEDGGEGEEPDCSQATASDVGVTEDTIKVGLISVDLTPLFGTGFVNENTPEDFFSRNMSLIHAINESGGINCRQVELVQETYDPARSAETQVPACERLAQDQEVFVAIAAFPDSAGGGVDCMWERFGIPFVTSGPIEQATIDASGGLVVGVRPTVEVMAATAAQTYLDLGLLDDQKVGVLGGDSGELGVSREAIVSVLEAEGVDVVDVELPSSGGTTAVWGVAPQVVASLVEQGVTTVIMLGSSVTMGPFYEEMKNNGADWQWLTVDTQAAGGAFAAEQMPDDWGAVAVTSQLSEERTSEADLECIEAYDLMKNSGEYPEEMFPERDPTRGNTNTTRPMSNDCALAKMLIVGLQNAGLNPTRDSFVEGLNNAGRIEVAFETDGTLEPGKGYLSDSARVYSHYPAGAQECIDLGYFAELGCWGPYTGDDPGEVPNVVPE